MDRSLRGLIMCISESKDLYVWNMYRGLQGLLLGPVRQRDSHHIPVAVSGRDILRSSSALPNSPAHHPWGGV